MTRKSKKKDVELKVKIEPSGAGLALPKYESAGASGMDVYSCMASEFTLEPDARMLVPIGISLEIPDGYEVQLRPRSGLAVKKGVTILNSPGTVDADYRGEVAVLLVNHGDEAVTIRRGERIAQMVLTKVAKAKTVKVTELSDTERGSGGFGSTGDGTGVSAPEVDEDENTGED